MSTLAKDIRPIKEEREIINRVFHDLDLAKKQRRDREEINKKNMNDLRKLEGAFNTVTKFINRNVKNDTDRLLFVSPILVRAVQQRVATDWIPQFSFEPQQKFGEGDDVIFSKNVTNTHNFLLDKGGFYDEAQLGAVDLFTKGRMWIFQGWENRNENFSGVDIDIPVRPKFKHILWENMYPLCKSSSVAEPSAIIMSTKHTVASYVNEFGDANIKNGRVRAGEPFNMTDESDNIDLQFHANDKMIHEMKKEITVVRYYNKDKKNYVELHGGGEKPFMPVIENGEDYRFQAEGKAYYPFLMVDASPILYGYHPVSVLDMIVRIWRNYSAIFNSTIQRSKMAAAPAIFVGTNDNKKAETDFLKAEARRLRGIPNAPTFLKNEGAGTGYNVQVADFGVNLTNLQIMRGELLDEMMIATGINLKALGEGAPTAEQERLRTQRELDVTREVITFNAPRWKRFCETNIYNLKTVESDMLSEYIEIQDEESLKPENQGLVPGIPGTIKDIVNELDDFSLNVKVDIDNSNEKLRTVENSRQQEAIRTVAESVGMVPALQRMLRDNVNAIYPAGNFTEQDFLPFELQQPEEEVAMEQPRGGEIAGLPTEGLVQ